MYSYYYSYELDTSIQYIPIGQIASAIEMYVLFQLSQAGCTNTPHQTRNKLEKPQMGERRIFKFPPNFLFLGNLAGILSGILFFFGLSLTSVILLLMQMEYFHIQLVIQKRKFLQQLQLHNCNCNRKSNSCLVISKIHVKTVCNNPPSDGQYCTISSSSLLLYSLVS